MRWKVTTVKLRMTEKLLSKKFIEREFDLTFMDIRMSGKNGVECFMEIQKIRPNTKIIMMTGYSVEELLNQAVEKRCMGSSS